MGVDLNLYLPPIAEIEDVAEALAAMHGLKVERRELERGSFYAKVEGVKYTTSPCSPGYVIISFKIPGRDDARSINFHYQLDKNSGAGHSRGYRIVSMPSSPRNIAAAKRLLKLFGGRLIYQDCGLRTFGRPDAKRPTNNLMAANDGAPWERKQTALLGVAPLTKAEVEAAHKHAAYQGPDTLKDFYA